MHKLAKVLSEAAGRHGGDPDGQLAAGLHCIDVEQAASEGQKLLDHTCDLDAARRLFLTFVDRAQ